MFVSLIYKQRTMTTNITDAQSIAIAVKGKGITQKRIAALEAAGFAVEYAGIKWNFGRACTQKGDLIQLHAATGCSPRSGLSVNRCEVYRLSIAHA